MTTRFSFSPRPPGSPTLVLILAVLLSSVCASSLADEAAVAAAWVPTAEIIAQMEAQIHLPMGASPLASYTRYYAGSILHGHRVVVGTYQHSGGGVVIEKSSRDLPVVYDGGCDFINVKYDVSKKRFTDVFSSFRHDRFGPCGLRIADHPALRHIPRQQPSD